LILRLRRYTITRIIFDAIIFFDTLMLPPQAAFD
jgi:hypothetical protein